MPGDLTLSQRLTGPDGLPTALARAGVVALMGAAAVIGYAAVPHRSTPAPPHRAAVSASRLAGDLPITAAEPAPSLRGAAALPGLEAERRRPERSRRKAAPAAVPVATPEPTAAPEPSATPEAPVEVPVAAPPAPRPAPAPAPTAAPRPRPTPAPTFDISG